jgi:hypothetical protein
VQPHPYPAQFDHLAFIGRDLGKVFGHQLGDVAHGCTAWSFGQWFCRKSTVSTGLTRPKAVTAKSKSV